MMYLFFQGDRLPAFSATITGLKGPDAPVVSYAVAPAYTGNPGVYIITPALPSFSNAANYTISYVNGNLYVNPDGPGAKKLRPSLDCIVEISNPQPGQFRYIAHFVCINDNATAVYVPIGTDNNVSSVGGTFDASSQPVVFLPGITRFNIPFDGVKLTWLLRTYDSNHKTSVASDASSTSGKCSIDARVIGAVEIKPVIEAVPDQKATVYPNPAITSVIVNTQTEALSEKGITVYNASGVLCPVRIITRISPNSMKLNVSGLSNGVYFIKCKTANGYRIFRFVKG